MANHQDSSGSESEPPSGPWLGLDARNSVRLLDLLGRRLPEVFEANRVIEQRTTYISESGRNNLVDALSHISTLAKHAGELTPEQQANQIAKIEEHMNRVLVEAPEEVVRARLVDIETRWDDYLRVTARYRQEGALRGVPSHDELERLRVHIRQLMERARGVKPDETDWEDWKAAAGDMTRAAEVARQLLDKLEECIGEGKRIAREHERDAKADRRARNSALRWVAGIAITASIAVAGYLVGHETAAVNASAAHRSSHAASGR